MVLPLLKICCRLIAAAANYFFDAA